MSATAIDEAAATTLVRAYVREWFACWESARARFDGDNVDFDVWGGLIDALDTRYFVPGAGSGSAGSFGHPAEHDPSQEAIVGFVADAERPRVETRVEHVVPRYWEYEIVLHDGAPRIAKMRQYLTEKGTPLVDPVEARKILAAPRVDAPLGPLERGVLPDADAVFAPGRRVALGEEHFPIEVRSLGDLVVESGVLAVRDFGYDGFRFRALERRVPPGRWPTEVAIVARRVAALRVRFGDAPVVAWHPANVVDGGHVVGVDAGNVAVFDVESFVALDAWEKERLYEAHVVDVPRPNARIVALRRENDCVVVDSGVGDGAYPCYWGVDAEGSIAQLFVDFLLVAKFLEDTARLEWNGGPIAHPLLAGWSVDVALQDTSLRVRGDAFKEARALRGTDVVFDTSKLGVRYENDEQTFVLPSAAVPPLTLEVRLATGYRNAE